MCMDTLPASPGLMRVKPVKQPNWIGDAPEQYFTEGMTANALIEVLTGRDNASGMRPIHLRLPLSMEVAEHSELSVTAVLTTDDFALSAEAESALRQPLLWVLKGGFLAEGMLPQESIGEYIAHGLAGSCAPLSLDVWPAPVGFWHNDYFQAGVRFPAPYVFDGAVTAACDENSIAISQSGRLSGTWQVWHDHWTPLYARSGATRVGMLTELRQEHIARARQRHGLRLGWVVVMKAWKRASEFGDLELTERSEFVLE